MVSPQLRKQVVVMRSEVEVPERRACRLTQIHRGTYRYRRRPEMVGCARLRVLAEERRRFGYHLQVVRVWKSCSLGSRINRVITRARETPFSIACCCNIPISLNVSIVFLGQAARPFNKHHEHSRNHYESDCQTLL
jgi:hypothetical protein